MENALLFLIFTTLMGCSNSSKGTVMESTGAPYDGGRFYNLEPYKDKSFKDFLKWKLFTDQAPWPEKVEASHGPAPLERVEGNKIVYTLINHATVLIQWRGVNILTDPIYSERTSPFSWIGPKRVRPPGIRFEDLPPIDVVVVSHNHYDHLDIKTLKRLDKTHHPLFLIGLKNGPLLKENGIENWIEMDWWQKTTVKSIEMTYVPAQHWSARGMFDRFETLWGGFYMSSRNDHVYFCGDSGYGAFFKTLKEKLGSPALSFFPIGAYKPRWFMKSAHMNPRESVQAHLDVGSTRSVGIHFETFQLTNEGYDEPRKELKKAIREMKPRGEFMAPEFGQAYSFELTESSL